jgi:hypothetical protein
MRQRHFQYSTFPGAEFVLLSSLKRQTGDYIWDLRQTNTNAGFASASAEYA